MKVYEGTEYAYCEECKQTAKPALEWLAGGGFQPICPVCADRIAGAATLELDPETEEDFYLTFCSETQCREYAGARCVSCRHPVCLEHHDFEGLCNDCAISDNRGKWRDLFSGKD